MRTRPILAAAALIGLAALPGLARAASTDTHTMTIRLPDGMIAQIQYTGDVPPKVAFGEPAAAVAFVDPFAMMRRMTAEMFQAVNAMDSQSFAGVTEAALPPGVNFCSRSIEIAYGGPGQAPHVVTHTSGNCGSAQTTAAPAQAAAQPSKPIEIHSTTQPFPDLVRQIDWRR